MIGNIWHGQGDEPCNSVPSFYTTIYPKTFNPIPIRDSASSNTGHQHGGPVLHPPACIETIYCFKFRDIHNVHTTRAEVV